MSGHKPGPTSRAFSIHGTEGTSRKQRASRSQQELVNKDLRTLYCIGCGRKRKPRSGPFCPDCSSINTERS